MFTLSKPKMFYICITINNINKNNLIYIIHSRNIWNVIISVKYKKKELLAYCVDIQLFLTVKLESEIYAVFLYNNSPKSIIVIHSSIN